MNKLNKKFAQAFLALGVLAIAPLAASCDPCNVCGPETSCGPVEDQYCDPCEPIKLVPTKACNPVCDCCFDLTVDFILWKPCIDNLDYALVTEAGVGETRYEYKAIDPKWEPGVRVGISKPNLCCGWGLSGSYTYLTDRSSDNVTGEVFPVVTHSGVVADTVYTNASSSYAYHYNAFDVLFSHSFVIHRSHLFTPFFGVQGLALDLKMDTTYSNVTDIVGARWSSDFIGAGLKVGSDYVYQAYDCIAFFARGSAAIVAGESDSHVDFDALDGDIVRFSDDDTCRFLNAYHFQVGLLYDWNICGCETNFRLGYEFVKWLNISNPREFVATGEEGDAALGRSTSPDTTTFGFHGLFAGIEMKY